MSTETASVLFTDLVASTELRQALGEERADTFRRTHDQLLTDAVEAVGGRVVKGLGDGIMAVFSAAADAVEAAVAIQRAASAQGRHRPDEAFKVRIGISVGDVSLEDGDYFGTAVVEASRLCDAAQGEQILVADLVRALARGRGSHSFESIGDLELKGLDAPIPACFVNWEPPSAAESATVPFPPLLAPTTAQYAGRLGLLAGLSKAWDLVSGGEGSSLVLLSGEPGVGKTRTAAEIARRAHEEGALVLYGRCDEELALPYEPFVEALDHQTANDPTLPLGRFAGDLRRLIPDLADRVPDLADAIRSDPRAEEHRLFEATAAWLTAVASQQGLVLVIDDLHWATRPTLQMMLHVERVLAGASDARSLLIGTYRDTDVDRAHPLFDVLADLRRLPRVERLPIEPLTEGEVMEFIADVAGHELDEPIRALARRTHAETEGNPYFVAEVIRHFVETGVVTFADGRWTVSNPDHVDVPEGVRDVIGRRLNRLSENANKILTAASVIGRDFTLDVVAAAADADADRVLDVLDDAMRARLVEETGPDSFRFAHALTRQTLYEELSATRRRRLHRRVVEALEEKRPGDLAGLAHHSIEAGPVDGDLSGAIRYSIAAGRQSLEQRAIADARGHFEAALELLEDDRDPDPEARLEARIGLGEAQRDGGDAAFRESLLGATREALDSGRADLAARAAMANSRGNESVIGAVDEERVELLEAVLNAHDGEPAHRALLQAQLAGELAQNADAIGRLMPLIDEARAKVLEIGDDLLTARVFALTMNGANTPDRLEQVPQTAQVLVEAADRAGDPTLRVMARMYATFGHNQRGTFEEGRAAMDEAAAIAGEEASPTAGWMADCFRVQYLAWDGDIPGARGAVNGCLQRGLELGEPDATNWYGALQSSVWWVTRELADAGPFLDQIAAQWPDQGVVYNLVRASVGIFSGDVDESQRLVDEHRLDDVEVVPHDFMALPSWNLQAYVALGLGLRETAERLIDVVTPFDDYWVTNGPWVLGPMALALGTAHAVAGSHAAASTYLERAWEQCVSSPVRCGLPAWAEQAARAFMVDGSTHARARARAIVEEGAQVAREIDVPLYVESLAVLAAELDGS